MSDNKDYTMDDFNTGKSLYEFVQEQLMEFDTTELPDEVSNEVITNITPEKVYFWTRIYLKEEDDNIEIGDDIKITWIPSGEELDAKFICYGKKGLEKNYEGEVINFTSEDDKRVLCLMIDEKKVNYNDDIPFIRTLFKLGKHFEDQLVKRSDLLFINKRNNIILDYYDCDF